MESCTLPSTAEAIKRFLLTRRARRVSNHTISGYENTLGKLSAMYPQLPTSANDIYALFLANDQLADASAHSMWRKLKRSSSGWSTKALAEMSWTPCRPRRCESGCAGY